jgi:hypothetical protein
MFKSTLTAGSPLWLIFLWLLENSGLTNLPACELLTAEKNVIFTNNSLNIKARQMMIVVFMTNLGRRRIS